MIVSNIPTYGTDAVAQYAIALLLELCHHIGEHSDCVKAVSYTHLLTTFKECGYDGNFCTEIFQIPSMEEAAAGAIRHLRPIADRVYGRTV